MAQSVAVVGGGITGTTCARLLAQNFASSIAVTLFDQGQRGFGGRTSHRRVDLVSRLVLPDDEPDGNGPSFDSFDHGCQFFFSASPRLRDGAVEEWLRANIVHKWENRRVLWSTSSYAASASSPSSSSSTRDFFGILSNAQQPCFVGTGGMHRIARYQACMAEKSGATLRSGTRVSSTRAATDGGGWELFGTSGHAAFHNTAETAVSGGVSDTSLGTFDAVVFTDASCSYEKWHRASAGAAEIAPQMATWIAARPRIPLFTAMITLRGCVCPNHDCIVFESGPVWYACRNNAKLRLGSIEGGADITESARDCWTLVSSPEFACQEIAAVPMRAPKEAGGSFRPQEDSYLNGAGGPAEALSRAFLESPDVGGTHSEVLYLQGQRWGSAVPGSLRGGERVEIEGTLYQRSVPDLTPVEVDSPKGASVAEKDFLFDDEKKVYYCGDFVSSGRVPGVEAAYLSAEDCARHVGALLGSR